MSTKKAYQIINQVSHPKLAKKPLEPKAKSPAEAGPGLLLLMGISATRPADKDRD